MFVLSTGACHQTTSSPPALIISQNDDQIGFVSIGNRGSEKETKRSEKSHATMLTPAHSDAKARLGANSVRLVMPRCPPLSIK